jgi:alkaline phosphatase
MKRAFLLLTVFFFCTGLAAARAKNVILFLGDAGGIPTLHAASVLKYDDPQKLFIHQMPHIALVDTSAADDWVTDSAAGMTAIVTGQKTNNGVLSQSASAVRGKKDGEVLKTILEYAEEHGLSTGVLSNMTITDATPAACYAHSNDRSLAGQIFSQVFTPRFGDGVDLIIGAGRKTIMEATQKLGLKIETALPEKGYAFYDSLQAITGKERRVVALFGTHDFDIYEAVSRALQILSRNRKGYFLMVEWDMHTDNLQRGLKQAIEMDDTIRKVSQTVGKDTLLLYAADHSFDIRLRDGMRGKPLRMEAEKKIVEGKEKVIEPDIRVNDGHTGEQILAAAQGPGAERLQGIIHNTDLFHVMMAAYGWKK